MKLILILASLALSISSFAEVRIYSAANEITFNKSNETKSFVGNGFLIQHKEKTYVITAKHVLFETQGSGITSVDIEGYVKDWSLIPFNSNSLTFLGSLSNSSNSFFLISMFSL